MGLSHAEARAAIVEAFQHVFGGSPTLREAQFAQAVSLGESGYGAACFKDLENQEQHCDTWNMGAVQAGRPPCGPGTFEATDTHAGGERYQACFRKYETPADGFDHFLGVLYRGGAPGTKFDRRPVRAAANAGSIENFSKVLRASGYFELPLSAHQKAMRTNLGHVTKALGEPMPDAAGSRGPFPFLAVGSALLAAGGLWAATRKRR